MHTHRTVVGTQYERWCILWRHFGATEDTPYLQIGEHKVSEPNNVPLGQMRTLVKCLVPYRRMVNTHTRTENTELAAATICIGSGQDHSSALEKLAGALGFDDRWRSPKGLCKELGEAGQRVGRTERELFLRCGLETTSGSQHRQTSSHSFLGARAHESVACSRLKSPELFAAEGEGSAGPRSVLGFPR